MSALFGRPRALPAACHGAGRRRIRVFPARPGGDAVSPLFRLPAGDVDFGTAISCNGGAGSPPSRFPARWPSDCLRGHKRRRKISPPIRSLDTLTAQALAGTEGALRPFWSPDSRFLGFFRGRENLKKIEVSGGPPITLCDASGGGGGALSRDGVIVFSPTPFSALEKVSASGGTPAPATKLSPSDVIHVRPAFLPDGRHFLYRTGVSGQGGPAYLASLDSTDRKLLLNADSTNVVYSQGHLLFLRDQTLMAQRFDTRGFGTDRRCISDCRIDSDSRTCESLRAFLSLREWRFGLSIGAGNG